MKHLSFLVCFLSLLTFWQLPVANAQTVKEKADVLIAAGTKHLTQPDSLNYYADQLLVLSRAEQYKTGEGWALKFKGIAENTAGNYRNAITFYEQGLKIFSDLGNELEIAKARLNLAGAYQRLSDHRKALEHGEKALYLFEKLKDVNGLGRVYNVIGITLMAQKNYAEAKNYFVKYNTYARQINAQAEIANSYNSLGVVYTDLKLADSAIYFFNRAAEINRATNSKSGLAHNLQNIGVLYHENLKNDHKALEYYRKAEAIYRELKQESFLSQVLVDIGQTYKNLRDTVNAKTYLNNALKMATKAGEKEVITQAYKLMSEIENNESNYKQAYNKLQSSIAVRDSLQGAEMVSRMQDLHIKYDTYKKQQQIKELEQQAELHKLQLRERNLYLIIGAGIIVFGIVVAIFINSRNKMREKSRLEQEKNSLQELMTRETLNAEERERRRIGHDLHDGVGQLLSAALLNLNSLADAGELKGQQLELTNRSIALVGQSYDEMRSISHQIIPNALLKAGLASAVKEFVNMINSDKLKVVLEITGLTVGLEDDQAETVLYRVIQETVTNVIKHAGATLLTIQLLKDEDGIALTIEDNGKGFDTAKVNDIKGTGLRNIQARIALLKGTVEFDSQPGKGTLVAIHVPNNYSIK